jgi:hypothetical protein
MSSGTSFGTPFGTAFGYILPVHLSIRLIDADTLVSKVRAPKLTVHFSRSEASEEAPPSFRDSRFIEITPGSDQVVQRDPVAQHRRTDGREGSCQLPLSHQRRQGWWHKEKCRSRTGRSTIDAQALPTGRGRYKRAERPPHRRPDARRGSVIPSTSTKRAVEMLVNHPTHRTIIRRVHSRPPDPPMNSRADPIEAGCSVVNGGVPQGWLYSRVSFALTLPHPLRKLPNGNLNVDECSWVVFITKQRGFHVQATALQNQLHATLESVSV